MIADCQIVLDEWFPVTFPVDRGGNSLPRTAVVPNGEAGPDNEVFAKAKAAHGGEIIARLIAGDISDYGDDHSRADLGLCSRLAFWVGPNPSRIDGLFRQTGLYRDKWDRDDYRDRTIGMAIDGTTAFYDWHWKERKAQQTQKPGDTLGDVEIENVGNAADRPARPPVERIPFRQLQADHPKLHPPVVDQWLREGETGNLISGSKIGKSWLVYYIILCFVTVRAIFDRFSVSGGRVLLIDNELHPPTIVSRIKTVADALGITLDEYADQIDVMSLRGNLRSIFELCPELEAVEPGYYKLILLDAKYRALGEDAEENSNSDETRFYNEADRLAVQTGAALLMVHHSTKGTQGEKRTTDVGAGAGAQSRAADCHLVLREHEEPDAIVLDAAVRSFAPLDPMVLRWRFPLWEVDEMADPALLKGKQTQQEQKAVEKGRETETAILEHCQTWRSRKELRTETGWGEDRVNRAIAQLLKRRMLDRSEETRRGQKCEVFRKSINAPFTRPDDSESQDEWQDEWPSHSAQQAP